MPGRDASRRRKTVALVSIFWVAFQRSLSRDTTLLSSRNRTNLSFHPAALHSLSSTTASTTPRLGRGFVLCVAAPVRMPNLFSPLQTVYTAASCVRDLGSLFFPTFRGAHPRTGDATTPEKLIIFDRFFIFAYKCTSFFFYGGLRSAAALEADLLLERRLVRKDGGKP